MAWVERGRVDGGGIVFPQPLSLPEGTEVDVRIEPVTATPQPAVAEEPDDFAPLNAFGILADRPEMADSAEWVRNERAKWQQRISRRP